MQDIKQLMQKFLLPKCMTFLLISARIPMAEATICFLFVKYEEVPTHIVQNILQENQDKE